MNAIDKLLTFGTAMLYFKRLCDIDDLSYISRGGCADVQPIYIINDIFSLNTPKYYTL